MFHVGLDVHLNYITVCVLNDNGKVYQRCTLHSIGEVVAAPILKAIWRRNLDGLARRYS